MILQVDAPAHLSSQKMWESSLQVADTIPEILFCGTL